MADGTRSDVGYVRRVVDDELDELFDELPAILLDGPKGVGKTETARQRAVTIRRLDDRAQAAVADADPQLVLEGDPPVLLDEWQRVPAVWDAVKRSVDADPSGGRFLLTGSAPFGDSETHSGAGRITTLRMRPFTLPERGATTPTVSLRELLAANGDLPLAGSCNLGLGEYTDQILSGGFPGTQHLSRRALRQQLDSYLTRIVDRDLSEAGFKVRRPATVKAWLTAYAAATSTSASWETIRDASSAGVASKPAKTTTLPYIEILTGLRILDDLEAWVPGLNHLKRLTQSPKHHLADPALAARLLGVTRDKLLAGESGPLPFPRDGTLLGGLFESLATLSMRVFAQAAEASVFHLRNWDQREVDLVVERDDGRVLAFEVKLASRIDNGDVRHLKWFADAIGDQLIDAAVVCTAPAAYRRTDGIGVIPLGLLGP